MSLPNASKVCSTCEEWKTLNEYYPDQRASDGRESRCRSCKMSNRKNATGEKLFTGAFATLYCPCDDCKYNDKCRKQAMACASFEKWVLTGRPNDIPRFPDRYYDEC
jgi:hypothetical protein